MDAVEEESAGSKRKRDDGDEEQSANKRRPSTALSAPLVVNEAVDSSVGDVEVELGVDHEPPGDSECGLCCSPVVGRGVLCGGCGKVFHPDTLCLGVSKEAVQILMSTLDGSLTFSCCKCRTGGTVGFSDGNSSAMSQILLIVGELVREVRNWRGVRCAPDDVGSGIIAGSSGGVGSGSYGSSVTISGQSQTSSSIGDAVMVQVRELREREKRANSIIIRGLGEIPPQQVVVKFNEICNVLNVGNIELVDVVQISSPSGYLYRAKIVNAICRKNLLLKSHELRNTEEFSSVYLNKDLTFLQRKDLALKRRVARNSPLGGGKLLLTGANACPQGNSDQVVSGDDNIGNLAGGSDEVALSNRQDWQVVGGRGGRGARGGRGSGGFRGSRGGRPSGVSGGGPSGGNSPANAPHIRRNHLNY